MRIEIGRQGAGSFRVPAFGPQCVCCNKHAMGQVLSYNASSERIRADAFPVPVCAQCSDHALEMHRGATFQLVGLFGGVAIALKAMSFNGMNIMVLVGAAISLATGAWIYLVHRRKQRELAHPGHHPRLEYSIVSGQTFLDTRNPALVERVLAMNPDAKRLETPSSWRAAEAKEAARRLAPARVVATPKARRSTPPMSQTPPVPAAPLVAPAVPSPTEPAPSAPSFLRDPDR
jgi:hypothetical protein